MNGTCIQIGLDYAAEYHYLTHSRWNEWVIWEQPELKQIPIDTFKHIDTWHYIGIDDISVSNFSDKKGEWIVRFVNSPMDIAALGDPTIDVLAMDIEGNEKTFFHEGWQTRMPMPKFIAVEYHPQYGIPLSLEAFKKRFTDAGYYLFRQELTNTVQVCPTIELQWLR